jgi:hypothetical protein
MSGGQPTLDHDMVPLGNQNKTHRTVLQWMGSRDPETGKLNMFWTSAFHVAPATSAALYKQC